MVQITSDSTADLNELFVSKNVEVMPLVVTLGSDSYLDGVDIDGNKIFDYVAKNKILPKTAARSIENFYDFFKTFTDKGDSVIHINISSELSASHAHALAASKMLPNVFVIDSRSLSSGTGLLVLSACDIRDSGADAKTIYDTVLSKTSNIQASFVVDTMEYLKKGGRCSSVVAIAASVLKIKPMIALKDGKMIVAKKYIGNFNKVILKYVEETLSNYPNPDFSRIFITHTYADSSVVDSVRSKIKELSNFKDIIETKAGATITSHCGKSTLGILFLNK